MPSPLSKTELLRIHERIDQIFEEIRSVTERQVEIKSGVDTNVALCRDCRPRVMGNGKEGLDARMARLETVQGIRKTVLLGAISLAAAVGTLTQAALRFCGW